MLRLQFFGGVVVEGDGEAVAAARRPRQVALLALLASAPGGFVRRDTVLGLLWPESSQAGGRAALRKAVYQLRQTLGEAVIESRGAEEIGLGAGVATDVGEFRRRLAAGELEAALEAYGGELLPGFSLKQNHEWDHWLETERAALRRGARDAALRLAAEAVSDPLTAARWAARAHELDPDDEPTLRLLLERLGEAGERAQALRLYQQYARRLAAELEDEPAAATQLLARRLMASISEAAVPSDPDRATAPAPLPPTPARLPGAALPPTPPPPSTQSREAPLPARRRVGRLAAALALLTLVLWVRRPGNSNASEGTLLAVGEVAAFGLDAEAGPALADMLATNLARVPGLAVLSTPRLYELGGRDRGGVRSAVEQAGADHVLEGAVHAAESGYRLELRRIDQRSARVLEGYRVEGLDLFDLVQRASVLVAKSYQLAPPAGSLTGVTTTSERAFLLYERGLREYYREHLDSAAALFRAALAEDSTFALATWYLAKAVTPDTAYLRLFPRAVALAARATERERLLIRGEWALAMEDPALLPIADTLARRYPMEPSGHLWRALALMNQDRADEAIPSLRAVIRLDTLSLLEVTPRCVACEAIWWLGAAYSHVDSAAAAERVLRAWTAASPGSAAAHSALAYRLESSGRYAEAERALRQMAAADPEYQQLELRLAGLAIHAGRYERADSLARADAGAARSADSWWLLSLSALHQGRYRAALALADSFRVRAGGGIHQGYLRGIVLLHMSRGEEAVALFDSIADRQYYAHPSRAGRTIAGLRTHQAAGYALLRDTAALRRLELEVRQAGEHSAFVRDQRMHHHVRGLRLLVSGKPLAAANAFEQARFGALGSGYARTNLEHGRALLLAGRPAAALQPLRALLAGPIGAAGTWASRTEAHELLAVAFDQLAQQDSAVAHYRAVLSGWSIADSELSARRRAAAERLEQLR